MSKFGNSLIIHPFSVIHFDVVVSVNIYYQKYVIWDYKGFPIRFLHVLWWDKVNLSFNLLSPLKVRYQLQLALHFNHGRCSRHTRHSILYMCHNRDHINHTNDIYVLSHDIPFLYQKSEIIIVGQDHFHNFN